jgi:hypothetical protein
MTSTDGTCVRNWKRQTETQKDGNVILRLLDPDETDPQGRTGTFKEYGEA